MQNQLDTAHMNHNCNIKGQFMVTSFPTTDVLYLRRHGRASIHTTTGNA